VDRGPGLVIGGSDRRAAPDPATGRRLTPSRVAGLLRKAGRQRNLDQQAEQIVAALRSEQLPVRVELASVHAASVAALVAVLTTMVAQTGVLEEQVRLGFGQHPDAEIYLSQPGLGTIPAARVLAEMGDDPTRYVDARPRKNYAGMAPITRASGTKRVVLARYTRNRRLADALYQQAFSALSSSPGARACYDRHRAAGATHHQALRTLANRLVGILHGCLRRPPALQRDHRLDQPNRPEPHCRLTSYSRRISRARSSRPSTGTSGVVARARVTGTGRASVPVADHAVAGGEVGLSCFGV
jgi:hypothetical protein